MTHNTNTQISNHASNIILTVQFMIKIKHCKLGIPTPHKNNSFFCLQFLSMCMQFLSLSYILISLPGLDYVIMYLEERSLKEN